MPSVRQPTDPSQRQCLQGYLDDVLSYYEPAAGGGVKLKKGSLGTVDTYALALTIQMRKLLPNLSDSQMIDYVSKASRNLIHKPVHDHTIEKLIDEINSLITQDGAANLSVIAFMNIEHHTAPKKWNIGGVWLVKGEQYCWRKFTEFELLRTKLSKIGNLTAIELGLSRFTPYQYSIPIPRYRLVGGVYHIHEEVSAPIEKLRSLLNYTVLANKESWFFSVGLRPRAPFIYSPLWFFEQDGSIIDEFIYDPIVINMNYPAKRWDESEGSSLFNKLSLNLGIENSKPNPVVTSLWGLLRLYQEALDTTAGAVTFLHYWQILERVASPKQIGKGIDTGKLIERLGLLFVITQTEKDVLKELGELRNKFAHVGDFPKDSGEYYIRIIKKYAEKSIDRLLQMLPDLSTLEDLEAFYVLASNRTKVNLEAYTRALKLVKRTLQ